MFFTKSRNRKNVLKLIENQDYDAASRLLTAYESEKALKTKDAVELKLSIDRGVKAVELEEKRQKVISELESALEDGDVDAARSALNQFGEEKIFDGEKIEELESKIYDWTERGLYSRIQCVQGTEKIDLADWYLQLYFETDKKVSVLKDLFFACFSEIINKFNEEAYFNKTMNLLENTTRLLKKYFKNDFSLKELVSLEELTSSAEQYLKNAEFLNSEGKLVLGAKVKYVFVERSQTKWFESYFKERNDSFPNGSEGRVVGLAGNSVYVKFDNTRGYEWATDWRGLSNYWNVEGKNVGEYHSKEISVISPINVVHKTKFNSEMAKIKSFFEESEKPPKKRHNPEITEADKVLPRSD